ncbi:hypothetical protein [Pseudomonas asplenii]|uniref:hypothetical protein n=1 Tax=Pseudomonas asplenii TaxID=53407 RepID=UPI001E4AFD58|nr:hypothetical protein [Pseudomonas fuscovaginae]
MLVALLVSGCSTHKPVAAYRDACLDEGSPASAEYRACVADRAAMKEMAFRALMDDTGAYSRPMQISTTAKGKPLLASDFPAAGGDASYEITESMSVAQNQAFPFKVKVIWRNASPDTRGRPVDLMRMKQLDSLMSWSVKRDGTGAWLCTQSSRQQRMWVFYAADAETFVARLKSAVAATGPYPVEFSSSRRSPRDPNGDAGAITPKQCVE